MAAWLEQLVQVAQDQLGERQREALWARGVSDQQIQEFRIGYLDCVLPSIELPKAFLSQFKDGTRLDDVFVLPLTNTLGQIKGLQFRHVDRDHKGYSDFIPYEDEPVLFGLGQAMETVWRTGSIWLVEGSFDLFPLQRHHPNIVATLTARLTTQFVRVLRRLVKEIWLGYDMDSTGREAIAEVVKTYGREFRVQPVRWPRVKRLDGKGFVKDPSDLWEAWGDDQLGVFLKRL